MSEVVEAEVVDDGPDLATFDRLVLTKRVKQDILTRLGPVIYRKCKQCGMKLHDPLADPKPKCWRCNATELETTTIFPGSTPSAAAQWAGIKPELLEAVVDQATGNPKHPNYRFVLDFHKKMAEREDYIASRLFALAEKKGDPLSYKVALEAQHRDWSPPKTKSGVTVNGNLTIVGKLQAANKIRSNKSLPTGD